MEHDSHKRFGRALGHAVRGFGHAFQSERNFRMHVVSGIVVLVLLIFFQFSFVESAIIIAMVGMVLFAELVNTGFEKTLDMLEPNHHPLVGKIKDMAAGAVLIISLTALTVGTLVAMNHFK